jgi:hypothetical protein
MRLRPNGLKTNGRNAKREKQMDHETMEKMAAKIRSLREGAEELKVLSGGIQAVERNADRILASVKMLEINISDLILL